MKLNPLNTPGLAAFALGRPLQPVGYRLDGRPIFPIAGGAPDDPPKDDPPKDEPPKDDPPKDEFEPITSQEEFDKRLGPRLVRERSKYADYDELRTKAEAHDKAVADAQTEQEKAVAAARKEGETTARQASDVRVVRAEAKAALATANAHNPGDAVKMLNLTGIKVGDDGEIDGDALKVAIDGLKESSSYLFDDGKGKGPKPDPSQGGGGGADGAKSVTQVMEDRRAAREAKQTK